MLAWLVASALAQDGAYGTNFQIEYFFGLAPHARNEALGRAGAALPSGTSSIFYNPATLGDVEEGNVTASHGAPFFILSSSDYGFVGASYRVMKPWVVAVSWHRFAIGQTTFEINLGGVRYPVDNPKVDNLTLTNAVELLPGLHLGVNVNAFTWHYLNDVPRAAAVHLDGGLYYDLALPDLPDGACHRVRAGVGVNNASLTRITFSDPAGTDYTEAFPVILRIGAVYEATVQIGVPGAGGGPLTVRGLVELQDVLNGAFDTALRAGAEAVLYDVVAVRVGGYTRTNDDLGNPVNRSRVSDFTYGFGLRAPIGALTEGRTPITVMLDYTALTPPIINESAPRMNNRRIFTLGVDWALPRASAPPPEPVEEPT